MMGIEKAYSFISKIKSSLVAYFDLKSSYMSFFQLINRNIYI